MTAIINAAGISKTTMYSRFSSKNQLFQAIIRKQIDKVGETKPLGPANRYCDLERGLKNFANRILEVSVEPQFQVVNRLIYSEAHRFPELSAAVAERNRVGINQVSHFVRSRAENDKIPCKERDTVTEVLILLMRGWYMNVTLFKKKVPAKERQDWVERAIQTLIATRENC